MSFKKPNELSIEEINQIFAVILDSKLQDELLESENHSDSWMLDYVYDSKLLSELEKIAEAKQQIKELEQNISNNNIIKPIQI